MYIIERLIGVGVYAFTLVLVCFFLACSTLDCKAVLRVYTAALCVMAFCYEPYVTADLYRIYAMVREFARWSFLDFLQQFVVGSAIPSARLFYWCVGKTGIPRLLPAAACLICYRCLFYMAIQTMRREQISRVELAAAVFFFMSTGNYMMLVSNIRTMVALSLIAVCLYRESVEGKYRLAHLLAYLTAATMHSVGAVLVVLRLVFLLLDGHLTRGKRLICAGLLCACGWWARPLLRSTAADIAEKFRAYVLGNQYSYRWEYAIAAVALCVELWVLYRMRRSGTRRTEYAALCRFSGVCIGAALVFWFEFSIFYRLVNCLVSMLMVPPLMSVLRDARERGSGAAACAAVAAVSGCLLVLVCCRGSLCGLKFFVL